MWDLVWPLEFNLVHPLVEGSEYELQLCGCECDGKRQADCSCLCLSRAAEHQVWWELSPRQPSAPKHQPVQTHAHTNLINWDPLKINFIAVFSALFMFHSDKKKHCCDCLKQGGSDGGGGWLWMTEWSFIYRSGVACTCVCVCARVLEDVYSWIVMTLRKVVSDVHFFQEQKDLPELHVKTWLGDIWSASAVESFMEWCAQMQTRWEF